MGIRRAKNNVRKRGRGRVIFRWQYGDGKVKEKGKVGRSVQQVGN